MPGYSRISLSLSLLHSDSHSLLIPRIASFAPPQATAKSDHQNNGGPLRPAPPLFLFLFHFHIARTRNTSAPHVVVIPTGTGPIDSVIGILDGSDGVEELYRCDSYDGWPRTEDY